MESDSELRRHRVGQITPTGVRDERERGMCRMNIQPRLSRIRPGLAAAIVIALVLAGGSVFSASGDPAPATYFGCLTPGGTLHRLVVSPDDEPDCPADQTLISWNELGPPGPQGLQG